MIPHYLDYDNPYEFRHAVIDDLRRTTKDYIKKIKYGRCKEQACRIEALNAMLLLSHEDIDSYEAGFGGAGIKIDWSNGTVTASNSGSMFYTVSDFLVWRAPQYAPLAGDDGGIMIDAGARFLAYDLGCGIPISGVVGDDGEITYDEDISNSLIRFKGENCSWRLYNGKPIYAPGRKVCFRRVITRTYASSVIITTCVDGDGIISTSYERVDPISTKYPSSCTPVRSN